MGSLVRVLLMAIATLIAGQLSAREVAITIDDLPYVPIGRTGFAEGIRIVHSITNALNQEGITATGFVIGRQVKPKTWIALSTFVARGHSIANHSWSHRNYNDQNTDEFCQEVQKTDVLLKGWSNFTPYFRFPFLSEGNSAAALASGKIVLNDLGYRNARVSIDNDEWKYNSEYIDALDINDHDAAEEIAQKYLLHMQERTLYFESLAHKKVGREIKHVLLIHMNKINADYLPQLLAWYRENGWSFITLEDALSDPVYAIRDDYIGGKGLSHIERISSQ